MRATIDKAGRLVIPKPLREQIGLGAGEIEVSVDGAGLRIEPIAGDDVEEKQGRLVIPRSGVSVSAETVRALRDAGPS
ncbi:MAG TPA: AbrB/MazE/SpoVT family DNA-binding domain-containing protein [Cryptosporangiaceae bacterium]|nr:AbrB/MazE/SpoVT family DNA-binding domain-containing protein [Cryptosporangiaceae bacterium]